MKVGIIGCGFIGTGIAKFLDNNKKYELISLNDINEANAMNLLESLKNNSPKLMDLNDLIKKCDLIIESAGKDAVEEILDGRNLDNKNKILLIMSTGGLIGNMDLLMKIKNCRILLPSGAIAGLDAIKSVSGKINSLILTTTKPIKSLENAPFVIKNKIMLENIAIKKIIFEGCLADAVEGFPQNINVAATLFLASKFDGIKIKIAADPNAKLNSHQIEAAGDFGKITTLTENVPSENPRTSYLAVLSAINSLEDLESNIRVGN